MFSSLEMLTSELKAIIGASLFCTCGVSMCKMALMDALVSSNLLSDGPSVANFALSPIPSPKYTSEVDMLRYAAMFSVKRVCENVSGTTSQSKSVKLTTNLIDEPGGRGGGDGGGDGGGGDGGTRQAGNLANGTNEELYGSKLTLENATFSGVSTANATLMRLSGIQLEVGLTVTVYSPGSPSLCARASQCPAGERPRFSPTLTMEVPEMSLSCV